MYTGKDAEQKRMEALQGEFSIRTHKELFYNYLEVVISPEGKIEYAVPSHQMKMMNVLMKKNNWTREELDAAVPIEFYFDMMTWLQRETGYIAVWTNMMSGNPNKEQSLALRRLTANGLYTGPCYAQQKHEARDYIADAGKA